MREDKNGKDENIPRINENIKVWEKKRMEEWKVWKYSKN